MEAAGTQILYNFVAYKNFMQLEPFSAVQGFVREKEYQYYLYKVESTCGKDCQLIVSLNAYSGTPVIVVSRGLTRLPTLKDHDILMETHSSEVLTITAADLKNFPVSSETDIDSPLSGYWVIGVSGHKNTTFQIAAVSQETPVVRLTEGLSV